MDASVRHLNPQSLHRHPAYSQAVAVTGLSTIVFIGGQNAVDSTGKLRGEGDLKTQSIQALRNVEAAVVAAGGHLENVVKWSVFIVEGQPVQPGFEAFAEVWPQGVEPPAITVAIVSGLARPGFLVEIEAVAVIG